MEVTTVYKEILPNVALLDEIKSVQPLPSLKPGGKGREFRETQHLLTYRFLFTGPPGTVSRKWIPANGDSTALAGKDSIATKTAGNQGAGPPPVGPQPDGPPPR
jgi:hypothetical protein